MPVRFWVVHGTGPLRLTNGLHCGATDRMAYKTHQAGYQFRGDRQQFSQDLGGRAGGSTSRSGETLDGFSL